MNESNILQPDAVADIFAAIQKMRVRGEEPTMIRMSVATFNLMTRPRPMKGNSRWKKNIRFRNKKRKPIRDYLLGEASVIDDAPVSASA